MLSNSDYTAGFALSRIGIGEAFDFSAPKGATVCEDWLAFGASRDWFKARFCGDWAFAFGTNVVDALTVFSNGSLRPRMKRRDSFISPFETTLDVVPSANWPLLGEDARPSRFWHWQTPSNTVVMTWQNVLLGQLAEKPVSFQVEIAEKGDVVFRYDLSRLGDKTVTNLVVGIRNAGYGRVFTQLDRNVTSLHWTRLDPLLASESDPDMDGISTDDEVFVYHTDPYSADTDMDMLSDYDEVMLHHTDPNDQNSVSDILCDGMATVIGDGDPFSCPEGSTNTVFEHVFYTGTTNAPFVYPVETDSSAVLKVTVRGTGSGKIVIGDRIVPLVARQRQRVRPLRLGAVGVETDPTEQSVYVSVGKGIRYGVWGSIPETLQVEIDSGAFTIGRLPRWYTFEHGWIAFPNTKASAPCIHDLGSREVAVSLDPGPDISDLTCTWKGSSLIDAENRPPLAAELTGRFPRSSTTPVAYTLAHPDHLFGATTYTQTARFCPRFSEDEDEEMNGYEQRESAHDEGRWCCFWGLCCNGRGECSCGCDCCSGSDGEDAPADTGAECPVHHVAYDQCASLHDAEYDVARRLETYPGVLKIRDPPVYDRVDLPCPEGEGRCCLCPDHNANHVSLAYRSCRLRVVDDSGVDFSASGQPCSVRVAGVSPSVSVGDARLAFATNGVIFRVYDETVLGMQIVKTTGPGLDTYNSLSRTLGLPMTVNTNLNHAVQLTLRTNVRFPFGNVRFSLDDTEGQFSVWRYDYRYGEYCKLLDSEGRSVINLTADQWRRLVGPASDSSSPETPIYITSSHKGSTTLRFGYWGVSDGKLIEDWDSQIITSVNPPLLPDYNRDGVIDESDAIDYSNGRVKYFWANQDGWQGDDAFRGYSSGWWDLDWNEPTLPKNNKDDLVNGRNDLVNFCPLAVSLSRFFLAWRDRVTYELVTGAPGKMRFVPVGTGWNDIVSMVRSDQLVVGSSIPLHETNLFSTKTDDEGHEVAYEFSERMMRLGGSESGVLAVEFTEPRDYRPVIRIREKSTGNVLYECPLDLRILDVHDMYRWVNLYGVCGGETDSRYADRQAVGWPDDEHADANVIFVHGYNMHPSEAWDWSQAMFKRLWWSGMDAGFTAVLWRGNESQFWGTFAKSYITRNYHQNVLNAFRTASALKKASDSLPGTKKFYIAHSLGNMLVSAAKQDHGLEYEKYVMLNAAVPIEAYDPESVTDESKFCMTPAVWRDYPDRVRATHWYELFPGGDARRTLTWSNRFANVDNTINFYSSADEVVANGNGRWANKLTRSKAWYNQECAKGGILVSFSPQAGWAFNDGYGKRTIVGHNHGDPVYGTRRYTPSETREISDGTLMSRPFFSDFRNEEIYGEGGSAFVRDNAYIRWYALSHGIPAESFAAGANPVPKWNELVIAEEDSPKPNVNKEIRNIDMETQLGEHKGKWIHSYFIKAPMTDTGGLYDSILDGCGLRKKMEASNEK